MNFNHLFINLFLAGTLLHFVLNHILEFVDFSFRKKHWKEIPESLASHFDFEMLEKTKNYENDKYFLWCFSSSVNLIITLALVYSGFYPWLFNIFWNRFLNIYWCVIFFSILSSVPESVLMFPFALYREFVIEKKYGFSKMTLKLLALDLLKNFLVSLVISVPLLLAATFLICKIKMWWLFVSCVIVAFSLLLSWIYPVFIAPLFNKFTPIEDDDLKVSLEKLLEKTGFKAKGLYVMDASKRSGHSNAYFTGFGKNKRIVLYDTLIEQLTPEEIEAVLAHELGHYKKHHILKRLCVSIPLIFVGAFLLSLIVKIPELYSDFGFVNSLLENGVDSKIQILGLFLISLAISGFEILTSPIENLFSRKDEFEADSFSKELCNSGEPLVNALIKLEKENLSEVQVPKIYSVFNYNHPPLLERIKALSE